VQLLLATRNAHKTREFRELLGSEFQISDLSGTTGGPIEETGRTFEENAILKATSVSKHHEGFVIADDSGLEVNALGGAPGIFSARYAGEKATDRDNVEKLLRELRGVSDRSAGFRCVIALARQNQLIRTFEGSVEGQIMNERRGELGFGYDPIFVPNGYQQTFAEMTPEFKNRISHRANAAAVLRKYLAHVDHRP
jgi:XTP/dITP diphosphohydrolase